MHCLEMAVYSGRTETNSQTFKLLKYSVTLTVISSSYTLCNRQHPLGNTAMCSIGTVDLHELHTKRHIADGVHCTVTVTMQ